MKMNKKTIDESWLDRLAQVSKFDRLADIIFKSEKMRVYLYIWLIFLLYFINRRMIIQNIPSLPTYFFSIIFVTGITFGVWAIRKMRTKYKSILNKLSISNNNKTIVRYKKILYLIGASVIIIYDLLHYSELAISGNIPFILDIVFSLLMTLPVFIEFLTIIINIHFRLPSLVKKQELKIDFTDPFKRSGLEEVSSLYLFTTQIYFVGILLYFLVPFYTIMTGIGAIKIGNMTLLIHFGAWLFGFVLFLIPQFSICNYVRDKKKEKIKEVHKEMRGIGKNDDSFPEVFPNDPDEMVKYMHSHHKLEMLHSQNEYPFDMGKVKELVSIAMIPFGLEIINVFII